MNSHLSPPPTSPLVVLDTNVVLDWLLFRNPVCLPLQAAIVSAQIRWIASVEMRQELAHVLARGAFEQWHTNASALWSQWGEHCACVPQTTPSGVGARMSCTDPDDQKFIDLALSQGARWLISRDRAVLKLARRTRPLGLSIVTPMKWADLLADELPPP